MPSLSTVLTLSMIAVGGLAAFAAPFTRGEVSEALCIPTDRCTPVSGTTQTNSLICESPVTRELQVSDIRTQGKVSYITKTFKEPDDPWINAETSTKEVKKKEKQARMFLNGSKRQVVGARRKADAAQKKANAAQLKADNMRMKMVGNEKLLKSANHAQKAATTAQQTQMQRKKRRRV